MILTGIWWLDMNKIYRQGSVEEPVITKTDPLKTRLVAAEKYYREGNSIPESSKRFFVQKDILSSHFKKKGILRTKGGSGKTKAVQLYENGFLSVSDISKKCGISVRSLYRELDRLGIEKRSEK